MCVLLIYYIPLVLFSPSFIFRSTLSAEYDFCVFPAPYTCGRLRAFIRSALSRCVVKSNHTLLVFLSNVNIYPTKMLTLILCHLFIVFHCFLVMRACVIVETIYSILALSLSDRLRVFFN